METRFEDFKTLARDFSAVPVTRRKSADLHTPLSVYQRLKHRHPYSFLLESLHGPKGQGRYSFVGADAYSVFTALDLHRTQVEDEEGTQIIERPLFDLEKDLMDTYKSPGHLDLPPLCGGLVGYYGYDCVGFYERFRYGAKDVLKTPLAQVLLLRDTVAIDNVKGELLLLSSVLVKDKSPKALRCTFDETMDRLGELEKLLEGTRPKEPLVPVVKAPKPKANMTRQQFHKMVETAKEHIRAGDIFQVVLSQRFEAELPVPPLAVYRALRMLNPSPYMFYLSFKDLSLLGSSPEILVTAQDGICRTRPLAGTRPRGKTRQEDEALEADLLADKKERAEHVMLVDLGRNDLGRVSEYGSVTVNDLMVVERYSHVMHLASDVTGKVRADKSPIEVLQAVMPAGTLSGAPKVRAMEIIDDLEPSRRGPYGGAIGYLSFSGQLDSCITLRTIVCQGQKAYLQAGAGIVADSDPEMEYQETLHKLGALFKAVEMACEGGEQFFP